MPIYYCYRLFTLATKLVTHVIQWYRAVFSIITMELAMLLKPAPLVVKKKGDPEQLAKDWEDYIKVFKEFLEATGVAGNHVNPEVANTPCAACVKAKNMLRLVGGDQVRTLFDHTGMVEDTDNWKEALEKVTQGIKLQTNQAAARFKLMQKMPQSDSCFAEWYPRVKEQAERCTWLGYNGSMAARDAILLQTQDKKLQQKILAEDLSYADTVKYGLALEQGRKKVDEINTSRHKHEDTRVARLEEQVRRLQTGKASTAGACKTCTRPTHGEGECPGKKVECFSCGLVGHFKGSAACKGKKPSGGKNKKKERANQVDEAEDEASDTDSTGVGRVEEMVRAADGSKKSKTANIQLTMLDHGQQSKQLIASFLIDSGVYRTLLSEEQWQLVQADKNNRRPKLKKNKVRLVPYGTNQHLEVLGRSKCTMTAGAGAKVDTIVYVVRGAKESLLGLKDGEALGIINIQPEGEPVRRLDMFTKEAEPAPGTVVSGGQTQDQIDKTMADLVAKFPKVFKGLGRATGVPDIHIEMDNSVTPVQQKQRQIPIQYKQKLKDHLEELVREGVVTPVECTNGTGWIHNVVITAKKWSADKIRMNLDTRPMKKAVRASHFHIPTPQELRHEFQGSNRFSVVDFNHAFHQFPMDQASKNLFTFHTPWGLHKLNTLVMGTHSGSSELQERVRVIVKGLEGVAQIKDDVVVHGSGKEHDIRLDRFMTRIQEHGLTLRKEKCRFGVTQVLWFGNVYDKHGMSVDPAKVQIIKDWPRPKDKAAVKSFLQTVQFCQVFMRPAHNRTYSDVTLPLRKLTSKSVRFQWTEQCQAAFMELKELMMSGKVMAHYDPRRDTRLYVDEGPAGVAGTVAQKYEVEGLDHPVWRPVNHTSRAKTTAEMNYGKVDGESLGVLTGIKSNKMYLYGKPFQVVVDHEPLCTMYNQHSREVTVRVAKHKSKLLAFDFEVIYKPGATNPCDWASRCPPLPRTYTAEEREEWGIEDEEEDREILVCRMEELTDAVTMPILQRHTKADKILQQLQEDINKGRLRKELGHSGYKECFQELSLQEGVVMRGDRVVIPRTLRVDVLEAAHLSHPGKDSMTRQLRLSCWWPRSGTDIKEFEESCLPCLASVNSNPTPPMQLRDTPDRPWQHCSADYKGPIAGKYYFHVLIDNYSRWPEVVMVTSTGFDKLHDKLEDSFNTHGIPDSITHDNGPCYNSGNWRKFAKTWGFNIRPCTPEHPQSNGIAERFMGVLVKVVHAAVASGQDPKVAVRRRLLNYRNTPHPSTGKTPAELMIRRQIKTRLPMLMKPTMEAVDKEAKAMDRQAREKRKKRFDSAKHAKVQEIKTGDRVLAKQQKTSINPPFDPKPYTVTEVKGTQVTAKRGGKEMKRNKVKMKVVKDRPAHLWAGTNSWMEEEEDSDTEADIQLSPSRPTQEEAGPVQEEQEQGAEQVEEAQEGDEQQQATGEGPRRSGRNRKVPSRYRDAQATQEGHNQLSPRERKRIKSLAAKRVPREEWMIRQEGVWKKYKQATE